MAVGLAPVLPAQSLVLEQVLVPLVAVLVVASKFLLQVPVPVYVQHVDRQTRAHLQFL